MKDAEVCYGPLICVATRCGWNPRLLRGALATAARVRGLLLVIVYWRALRLVVGKIHVQQDQQNYPDDRASNDILEVLQPKLVLQFPGLLLKLRGTILQSISPLIQLRELLVTLQDFFNIVFHDADHLIYLGLLLSHASLGHNLLHLLRPGKWLAVGPEGTAIWGRLRRRWRRRRFGGHLRCE